MKKNLVAAAAAVVLASVSLQAQAESVREWGYWDSAPTQQQVQQPSVVRIAGLHAVLPQTSATAAGVSNEQLPSALLQNVELVQNPELGEDIQTIRWLGYAALDTSSTTGAYDVDTYLDVGANWTYGDVPPTFTFRIAGEKVNGVTLQEGSQYEGWTYEQNAGASTLLFVKEQLPMPSGVPMTMGYWQKGDQAYYSVVGSVTPLTELQNLSLQNPQLTYSNDYSMGGKEIRLDVDFSAGTWSGAWTPAADYYDYPTHMTGNAASTPNFTAQGIITGANISSTAITLTDTQTAADSGSFVQGTFYGDAAQGIGGLSVIKDAQGTHTDIFVLCEGGYGCFGPR